MNKEEYDIFYSRTVSEFLEYGPARKAVANAIKLLPGGQVSIVKEGLKYCGTKLDTYKDTATNAVRGTAASEIYVKLYFWLSKTKPLTEYKKAIDVAVFGRVMSLAAVLGAEPRAPFLWPAYVLKERATEAEKELKEGRGEAIWLNPHNHYSIPLEGRKDEIEILDDFIRQDAPFLKTFIIAPSGAGKTRLVSQWMRKLVADPSVDREGFEDRVDDWDAGFVERRDAEKWEEWQPTCHTLIVIDYTYNYDSVIKAIADKAKQDHGFKIRLLILDHVKPTENSLAYAKAEGGAANRGTAGDFLNEKLEHATIELLPDEHSDALLGSIIARVASLFSKDEEYAHDDLTIVKATKALVGMATAGEEEGEDHPRQNASRHPLFAALMGQAIGVNQQSDFSKLRRRDLIDLYFEPVRRIPWHEDEDINPFGKTLGPWVGCFISIATLIRGVSFDDLFALLPEGFAGDMRVKQAKETIKQLSNNIVSGSDTETLKPFEPDILGESFFLKFLDDLGKETSPDVMSLMFKALCKLSDSDVQDEVLSNFSETIQRLVRNLVNDDQTLTDTNKGWSSLPSFLSLENFSDGSNLRHLTPIILTNCVGQMRRGSLSAKNIEKFASGLDLNDLLDGYTQKPDWTVLFAGAVLEYLEWKLSTHLIGEETSKRLLDTVEDWLETEPFQSIHRAAELGHTRIIEIFIADEVDLNQATTDVGYTPLMIASERGFLEIVQLLVLHGADINRCKNDNGFASLALAGRNGHLEVSRFLVLNGASLGHGPSGAGVPALIPVSASGQTEVLQLLLSSGAEVNLGTADLGFTALMAACQSGQVEAVRMLLQNGAEISPGTINGGFTALMAASQTGQINVMRVLISYGVDVKQATTKTGYTALILASQNGYPNATLMLLSNGAEVNECTTDVGASALMAASHNGHLEVVKILVSNGADVNQATLVGGFSALIFACQNGHHSIAEFLISRGANTNHATTDKGLTALLAATMNGHEAIARLLISNGADVNKGRIEDGVTALHYASEVGHTKLVKLLILSGADVNQATNDNGCSALILASQNGFLETAQLLISNVADVNQGTSTNGFTALMAASQNGHKEIVELLISNNADINMTQLDDGLTAMAAAISNGNKEIVKILVSNGADFRSQVLKLIFKRVVKAYLGFKSFFFHRS